MNLSKRSEYALRAPINLGIARELSRPILQVSELAANERLPIKFLEQILTQLRVAGYVETKRGKLGGTPLQSQPPGSSSTRSFASSAPPSPRRLR